MKQDNYESIRSNMADLLFALDKLHTNPEESEDYLRRIEHRLNEQLNAAEKTRKNLFRYIAQDAAVVDFSK